MAMRNEQVFPILYEMAMVIGGETSLKSLLRRTLQRLLYYTSYPAGFVCLDLPAAAPSDSMMAVPLQAVVGDYGLSLLSGKTVHLPADLLLGGGQRQEDVPGLLAQLPASAGQYRAYLRLPIKNSGVIILLAPQMPASELPLTQMFQPVMDNLANAIRLCRQNDAQMAAVEAQRGQLEQSLRRSELSFRSLIELSPIGVGFSRDGITIDGNQAFLQMFGYASLDEVRDKSLLQLIAPARHADIRDKVRRRAAGLPVESIYETEGVRKDGSIFPFLVSAQRVELPEGAVTFTFFIDLTEQKRAEAELRATNEMLHSVVENAPLRIFWKDLGLRYLGCNTAFARDAGKQSPQELIGEDDFAMGWRAQAEMYRADDRRIMDSNTPRLAFEEPQTTPDGQEIWLRTSKVPLHGADGKVIGILGIYDDITEQKRAEQKIRQLAFFDSLTGLPNRRLLMERMRHAMSAGMRSGRYGALMLLDLDQFKTLNDTRGHSTGDQMLIEVARRLQHCVREEDTVARLGGDEFIAVLEGLSSITDEAVMQAELVAEKIRSKLTETYALEGGDFHTSPSIGITLFRGHQHALEDLFIHADTAMYQAKAAGRNAIRFYDPQMQATLAARSEMEVALRSALEHNEFRLFYQAQVDSQGQITGAEVLLRWRSARLGMVSPAQFIPVAEETGLIIAIGSWVLETACAQLARWQTQAALAGLTVAVNVSARQFRQGNFVARVDELLKRSGIDPAKLKLELTESLVLDNVEESVRKMGELRQLGVRFSMDDFGTGYSSLTYLKRLPLDQIKIDQSFVRDITTDQSDAAIVQTIIAMAHSLGLDVIAEGVETEAQREFLDLRGCRAYQGYLFGRPVEVADFEAALQRSSDPGAT
jgi:diguanylate cyclase (GGDEF)-like protein/PAS domain S-box-containing protein